MYIPVTRLAAVDRQLVAVAAFTSADAAAAASAAAVAAFAI